MSMTISMACYIEGRRTECGNVMLVAYEFLLMLVICRVGFFGFSDKCEMCLRVVGANNYIFNDIYK